MAGNAAKPTLGMSSAALLWLVMVSATTVCDYRSAAAAAAAESDSGWELASATWYGSPDGDGSDGGACGYGSLASTPYGSNTSATSSILFRGGKGCGACYQVKCVGEASLCSSNPVTVVITDECPGCEGAHFDMSGFAFGNMATTTTLTTNLLDVGLLQVLYKRIPCSYHGATIAFQVNQGATNEWFSILIKYVAGDGDLSNVELMQADAHNEWQKMTQLWGAYWCLNEGPVTGPFSLRITSSTGSIIIASNVIPYDWSPGAIYISNVNFL